MFPNYFYEASFTLLWKPGKEMIRNEILDYFMNIDGKILYKILANH